MAVDINHMKFMCHEHPYELLLMEVNFEHFGPVCVLRVERGPRHVKDWSAMENHELARNPGSLGDRFFVLGNMQETTARNDNVEGIRVVAEPGCVLHVESNGGIHLPG